jgi:AraC family transcriptional regulator, regulatory protein of adaptative response / methylated-DNA-[protein]-cysteine methyltransferase
MNLMIFKDAFRVTPAATPAKAPFDVLSYATAECWLGQLLLARSAKGVCAILIGDCSKELVADLAGRFPQTLLLASESAARDDLAKVIRFVDKTAEGLYLPLVMRGKPLQFRVWQKLRAIPAGRTVTYVELAHWISPFASPRAVAGACAANPIALAIPCHHVVCGNTDVAGYHRGVERKRERIRREAKA